MVLVLFLEDMFIITIFDYKYKCNFMRLYILTNILDCLQPIYVRSLLKKIFTLLILKSNLRCIYF